MDPTALLEREHEIAVLDEAIERLGRGNGGAVVFEGVAGIGKTALLAQARARAHDAGLDVLTASGGELERDLQGPRVGADRDSGAFVVAMRRRSGAGDEVFATGADGPAAAFGPLERLGPEDDLFTGGAVPGSGGTWAIGFEEFDGSHPDDHPAVGVAEVRHGRQAAVGHAVRQATLHPAHPAARPLRPPRRQGGRHRQTASGSRCSAARSSPSGSCCRSGHGASPSRCTSPTAGRSPASGRIGAAPRDRTRTRPAWSSAGGRHPSDAPDTRRGTARSRPRGRSPGRPAATRSPPRGP